MSFCSQTSLDGGEPMLGRAPHFTRYLFIECPSPWSVHALESVHLPMEAVPEIQRLGRSFARINLIANEHTHKTDIYTLYYYELEGNAYRGYVGTFCDGQQLHGLLMNIEQGQLSSLEANTARCIFVCTDGVHDQCCGRLGVPVYRGLQAYEEFTIWQVSHLGGHRFAPTLCVFPCGRYYGRVTLEMLPELVASIGADRPCLSLYRGLGAVPRELQYVEAYLWSEELLGDGASWQVRNVQEGRYEVQVDGKEGVIQLQIQPTGKSYMALGSCGDVETTEFIGELQVKRV